MSYQFRIQVEDGHPQIVSHTENIPNGQFEVSGHEDDHHRSINISRKDDAGGPAIVQTTLAAAR